MMTLSRVIRLQIFLDIIVPSALGLFQIINENDSPEEMVTQKLINKYFAVEKCISILYDSHSQSGDIIKHLTFDKEIPWIHIAISIFSNSTEIVSILLKIMNLGCSDFIIDSTKLSLISESFYYALKSSSYRGINKYVVICSGKQESLHQILDKRFLRYSPNTLIVNNNRLYEVRTPEIGNNFQITSFNVNKFKDLGTMLNNLNFLDNVEVALNGVTLKLSMIDYSPYAIPKSENSPDEGTEFRLTQEVAKRLNFTWQVDIVEGGFGVILDDGSVTGLAGSLVSGDYIAGIPGEYIRLDYYQLGDFTTSYLRSAITFLTPKPMAVLKLWSIFDPFKRSVWIAMALFIVTGSLFLHMFARIQYTLSPSTQKPRYLEYNYALLHSISLIAGLGVVQPRYSALRHLMIWTMFTSIMLAAAYSTNLVSHLTIPSLDNPIDTVKEFADSGLEWGIVDESWEQMLSDAVDEDVKRIKTRAVYDEDGTKLDRLARQRLIAILAERTNCGYICGVDFLTEEALLQQRLLKEDAMVFHIGLMMEKGSPLVDKFSRVIRWLRDCGIIVHWERDVVLKYRPSKTFIPLFSDTNLVETQSDILTIKHMQGAFVLLLSGCGIALLAVVFEFTVYKLPVWKSKVITLSYNLKRKVCKKRKNNRK